MTENYTSCTNCQFGNGEGKLIVKYDRHPQRFKLERVNNVNPFADIKDPVLRTQLTYTQKLLNSEVITDDKVKLDIVIDLLVEEVNKAV
jgi:hypothetical protein